MTAAVAEAPVEDIDRTSGDNGLETLRDELAAMKKELTTKTKMLRRVARAELEVESAGAHMEGLRADLDDAQKRWKEKVKKLQAAVRDAAKGQPTLPGCDEDEDGEPAAAVENPATAQPAAPGEDTAIGLDIHVLTPDRLREATNREHAGISVAVADKLVDLSLGTVGLLEARLRDEGDFWFKDLTGIGKGKAAAIIDALAHLRQARPIPLSAADDEFILDEQAEALGRQCHAAGAVRTACPYGVSGMQGRSWLIGWDNAAGAGLEQAAQTKAHNEGFDACLDGVPVANCPHPTGSMLANFWQAGWQDAADKSLKSA